LASRSQTSTHSLPISGPFGGTAGTDTVDDRQRFEQARASLARTLREVIATAPPDDERTRLVRDIAAAEARGIDPVDEIAALLFAGIDTSAAALSWALFLLAASPDLQASLRRTVRETTGGAPGTLAHLEAMPDLAAFRNEVLRIFPPIPAIGRTPIAADRIGEVPVAAGQPVMISIIGLHHDPRHFPSPASVRLKRYPPGELGSENVGHHLPFGDGRRVCVGSRIANVETSAALAVLVDRLKFALPDMRPLEFEWTASMRRKGGQYLLVRPAE
jgi:cytochrome P450